MSQIKAKIILDSVECHAGVRITTFELEYPRFIHAEFMTHRVFSRNAASSRAIPVEKVLEQVRTNPARPIHWGKNQSGMQANEELDGLPLTVAQDAWFAAARHAAEWARTMTSVGAHKQVVNRILEPFQMIKVVMTTTELQNFFELRNHKDAQPEIQELAKQMLECYNESTPGMLAAGEWHLPYVGHTAADDPELETKLKLSASLCAQVSYRKADESIDKAIMIFDKLVTMRPVHASPFEHQAMVAIPNCEGFTHTSTDGAIPWSGNFRNWIQYRQLITSQLED